MTANLLLKERPATPGAVELSSFFSISLYFSISLSLFLFSTLVWRRLLMRHTGENDHISLSDRLLTFKTDWQTLLVSLILSGSDDQLLQVHYKLRAAVIECKLTCPAVWYNYFIIMHDLISHEIWSHHRPFDQPGKENDEGKNPTLYIYIYIILLLLIIINNNSHRSVKNAGNCDFYSYFTFSYYDLILH